LVPVLLSENIDGSVILTVTYILEGEDLKVVQPGERTNYCVFCEASAQKIVRHYERFHHEEPKVKAMMSLPKQSNERRKLTSELRLEGNHKHNIRVLTDGAGVLIVAKSLKNTKDVGDFVPCSKCLSYVGKADIYRHRCMWESGGQEVTGNGNKKPSRLSMGKQLLQKEIRNVAGEPAQVLTSMKNDDVGLAVKHDPVALDLLNRLLQKGQGKRHLWIKHTRYRLRLLGRFILQARKLIPGAHSLEDILKRENFLAIVEASKLCGGGEEEEGQEDDGQDEASGKKPTAASVPLKVGYVIKASLQTILGNALMKNDILERKNAEDLLRLYEMQWGDRVSSKFLQLSVDRRMNRPDELPTEEDFAKLISGLKEKLNLASAELQKQKTAQNWRRLADAALALIIFFNGKRGSEVAEMKLVDFVRAMQVR
jgi:hypothetical protein